MSDKKYAFSWDLLGDLETGRPNLGRQTHVAVYRLMQFTLREAIESRYGTEAADAVFRAAGKRAGQAFYEHYLSDTEDVRDFILRLQTKLKEFKIGILRVEAMSDGARHLTLAIDEDLDCSGLPEVDFEVCVYDEGFLAGILEGYIGRPYTVKEIDCWCTGDRTCRFSAEQDEGRP